MVTAIHNDYIMFAPSMKGYISVIVHGDKAEGVNISGLKYTLDNATLTGDFALGLSNEFIGQEGKVEVKNGTLIIIFSKQK